MKKLSFKELAALICAFLILVGSLAGLTGCGNDNQELSYSGSQKNGKLFTTEYTIEDYHNGRFIVSKLDGELFGVLDMKGKEIIPVKYDSLWFGDHTKYQNYIYASYEGKEGVFDLDGKVIIPVEYDKVAKFENACEYTFAYNSSDTNHIYNNKGDLVGELEFSRQDYDPIFLGDKYVVLARSAFNVEESFGFNIVDFNGNIVKDYDVGVPNDGFGSYQMINNGSVVLVTMSYGHMKNNAYTTDGVLYIFVNEELDIYGYYDTKDSLKPVIIAADEYNGYCFARTDYRGGLPTIYTYSMFNPLTGEITDIGEFIDFDGFSNSVAYAVDTEYNICMIDTNGNVSATPGTGKNYFNLGCSLLYYSNETWKLVDKNGENVADERYYEAGRMGGDVKFYWLLNEEGEICVFNPNGEKVVPYGTLVYDGDDITLGEDYIRDCYSSYDAIIFITSDEDGNNVVNWYGKTVK